MYVFLEGIKTLDKTGVAPDGSRTKEINHYLRRHSEDVST